jgi:hypothetical protein
MAAGSVTDRRYVLTRTRQALLCMIGFTIPNIAGMIVLLTVAPTTSTRGGLIVAFYAMQFFQAVRASHPGSDFPSNPRACRRGI